MNNNDDGFKDNVEYMAPNEMPTGQILTPTEVIESSDDLRPYVQLVNAKLKERECDSWLISIECDLNVQAIDYLFDLVKKAGWSCSLEGKTISIR
ncbi:hypothetical protein [Lacticaseibacillus paracasei]|uniref:hypothetical protein n=1 Tax=Lacticaseibacillus paracasei TaxID=1597 RepID=UPI0021A7287C|nr:hypothetical protein [Lacticaseibacillus paracasei]MCT4383806.1 hypothetical protein [Lacticaseibacillus paracasei]